MTSHLDISVESGGVEEDDENDDPVVAEREGERIKEGEPGEAVSQSDR